LEGNGGEVTLGGVAIPTVDKFKYLGSIIEERGNMTISTIVLGRGGKNEGMHLECYVIRKFL